eukprot:179708-Hanusia_phi.AAC.1
MKVEGLQSLYIANQIYRMRLHNLDNAKSLCSIYVRSKKATPRNSGLQSNIKDIYMKFRCVGESTESNDDWKSMVDKKQCGI